jgi:integrative and conjugative element protein (TIGR02256 family)
LVVDDLTEPSRGDQRRWASFFRSLRHHAKALARWHRSGGTCTYLGSWHTHPESDPKPSRTDIDDWQHALARDRFEGDSLFFAIVGTASLRVWQGTRRAQLEELHLKKEA